MDMTINLVIHPWVRHLSQVIDWKWKSSWKNRLSLLFHSKRFKPNFCKHLLGAKNPRLMTTPLPCFCLWIHHRDDPCWSHSWIADQGQGVLRNKNDDQIKLGRLQLGDSCCTGENGDKQEHYTEIQTSDQNTSGWRLGFMASIVIASTCFHSRMSALP